MATIEFTTEELASEEWRPVVGWEGRYEVSNLGRVKSLFARGKPNGGELILKARVTRKRDYLHVHLGHGAGSTIQVHTIVATAFVGPRPTPKAEVNHKDGVKINCRSGNLEWTTRSGNTIHAYRLGLIRVATGDRHGSRTHPERIQRGETHWMCTNPELIPRGESHYLRKNPALVRRGSQCGSAKLDEQKVGVIKSRLAAGELQRVIAADFGVRQTNISLIAVGKRWRHVMPHESPSTDR